MSTLNTGTVIPSVGVRLPVFTDATRPVGQFGLLIYNSSANSAQIWNGSDWVNTNASNLDGSTAARAAISAQSILQLNPLAPNGIYWINLPTVGATQIYCLMDPTYAGGGWMMGLKATRGTTFEYNSSYWTTANTLNTTQLNLNDGDAKFEVMNRYAAKDMMAVWPDIPATNSQCILGVTRGHVWLQGDFNGGTRITPISFWSSVDRYFIMDANNFCGINNFSRQTDVRFYGYNYRNNPGWGRTRWGFGWNENGGGLYPGGNMDSDDVSGGIGMTGSFGTFSAGDRINCCQNVTGINRSARVEIYFR